MPLQIDCPYGLAVVTPAAGEPVSLAEAKAQLRVDTDLEDALITALIQAAREHVEAVSGYQLMEVVYRLDLPQWYARIDFPRPPLQTVDSVTYLATDGTPTVLDPGQYVVLASKIPGSMVAADGVSYPSLLAQPDAVQIQFTAGYATAADVPATYKAIILLLVADLYEHREAQLDGSQLVENKTVQRLFQSARLIEV